MRKYLEISVPGSCLNRAKDEEMLFTLLGRDPCAPLAIRVWVEARIALGKNTRNDPQILEALQCAATMEAERK